jgi:hypothetical protein
MGARCLLRAIETSEGGDMTKFVGLFCVGAAALWGCGPGGAVSPQSSSAASAAAAASSDGGRGRTPSAEDVAACNGKAAGATCADIYDGGDPGTCQLATDGTTLYCVEANSGHDHGGGGTWVPSAEDVSACTGKVVNDACVDVFDGGDPGTCQLASDGTTVACREQHAATRH